jgi:GNAT superfamily N-acetyltransferase
VRIIPLSPGPQVDALYQEILQPSFPAEELCGLDDVRQMIDHGHPSWIAVDDDGQVLGGAVGDWEPGLRVILLSWLAIRPGLRGGGVGGKLLDTALDAWRRDWAPCLVLAEVEDPAQHHGSELTGDPTARLRFYRQRGGRALDLPYFQASLRPGAPRVPGLLLMVLHADAQFAGQRPDTIDSAVVREYLEIYQQQCEGQVGTDEQANALWRALDAYPDGVPYLAG